MGQIYRTNCPICGSPNILVNQHSEEIPYFGPIIILTIKCDVCGFKDNDLIPVNIQEPKTYKVKVENVKDLNIKVIRSSSGFIEIPELGVEITPGPYAQGFITNIEGLLDRIEEVLKAKMDDEREKTKCEKFLLKLKKAREGKFPFTVVLKDPAGTSALVSEKGKVEVKKMSKKEVEKFSKNLGLMTYE